MKKTLLIYMILLSSHAFGSSQELCYTYFKKNIEKLYSEDINLISKINRYEAVSDTLRRFRTKKDLGDSLLNKKIKEKMLFVEAELYRGKPHLIVRKYKRLYRKVESSTVMIQKTKAMLKTSLKIYTNPGNKIEILKKSGLTKKEISNISKGMLSHSEGKAYLKTLKKELNRHHKILGNNYLEYKALSEVFTELLESSHCTQKCRDSIAYLKKELTLFNSKERAYYGELLGRKSAIHLLEVDAAYEASSFAFLITKKKELLYEFAGFAAQKLKNVNIVDLLSRKVGRALFKRKSRLARFFRGFFDVKFKKYHIAPVNKIGHFDGSPEDKLNLLTKEAEKLDRHEFLVSLGRSTDERVKKSFKEITELAKSKNPTLYEEIQKALKLAKRLGSYGGQVKGRAPYYALAFLTLTGASVGYLTYDEKGDESTESVQTSEQNGENVLEIIDGSAEDTEMLEAMEQLRRDLQIIPPAGNE